VEKTAAELRKGTTTIYEAVFEHNGVFMKADILQKGAHGWELNEVKATTEVKDMHVNDVALWYYVLTGAGIDVSRTNLVHLSNQCVRNGAIEVDKLFVVEDLTEATRDHRATIASQIAKMREVLSGDTPVIDIGKYCDEIRIPAIFTATVGGISPRIPSPDLRQREAHPFEGDYPSQRVPLTMVSGSQLMQFEAFLDTLWYPLYFLDFETFAAAIPPFDEVRPHQQIPFQYSLHYIEREGAGLGHHEFLAEPNVDPRPELADRLVREIPEHACVVAYNAAFEAARLRGLAEFLPKQAMRLRTISENMRDLMVPFRQGSVYHWQMKGSYSQKAVLPTLVPDLCATTAWRWRTAEWQWRRIQGCAGVRIQRN
jgi:hypothetical protein